MAIAPHRKLSLGHRQTARPVHLPLLRQITRALLEERFHSRPCDLGIYLVSTPEMKRINERFLHHSGSTDVITFAYSGRNPGETLHGEIFICVPEAVTQARRFHTCWQSELVRYLVHAVLHLEGFDDAEPAPRREMKREEDRVLKRLAAFFDLRELAARPKVHHHEEPDRPLAG